MVPLRGQNQKLQGQHTILNPLKLVQAHADDKGNDWLSQGAHPMRIDYLLGCQRKSGLWQAINVLLLSDELLEGFGGILRMQRGN